MVIRITVIPARMYVPAPGEEAPPNLPAAFMIMMPPVTPGGSASNASVVTKGRRDMATVQM